VPLMAGDSITIYPFVASRRNAVTIRGAVAVPGTYQLDAGMRLTDLIALAGGVRQDIYTGRAQILRTDADSTRRMIGVGVPSSPGDENPPLAERDEVTVFARSDFRPDRYVAVWGAVRKPGYLPYADSMTVHDVILLAGGLTEEASLDSAQVSRFRAGAAGDSLQTVFTTPLDPSFIVGLPSYPPQAAGANQAPTVVLHPYDQVQVRRRPGWEAPGTVVISGEVRYPGHYALLSKDERLRALVDHAGGLTSAAYPNGIQFFRLGGGRRPEPGARPPTPQDTMANRRPDLAPWNTQGPPAGLRGPENRRWGTTGRIGVDLERVLGNPSHRDNLILQPGDSVHLPQYIPFVRVEGSVGAPGTSVPYRPGAGVRDYVNSAGGFAQMANKGGTFVQQPNGLIQKGGRPQAGAVVVVPERLPGQRTTDLVQLLAALSPLISGLTTVAVLLISR